MSKTIKIDFGEKIHKYAYTYSSLVQCWYRLDIWIERRAWGMIWDDICEFFSPRWNNIIVFLTPWYAPFWHLLSTFANCNGMKLLGDNRNYAHLRTRDNPEQYYYTLRKRWLFWAELEETKYIDTLDNTTVNAFAAAMETFIRDDDLDEIEERYQESSSIICRGFILTKNGCQRMLDRIVDLTKDKIDWIFSEENVNA